MTILVALLRAVNVAGHGRVKMTDLCTLLERLGHTEVRSLLQSGNLVFRSKAQTLDRLEQTLEAEVERQLAVQTSFFIRTAREWQALVAANPFPAEAEREPGKRALVLLKHPPSPAAIETLQGSIQGPEIVRSGDRALFALYPNGFGRSKLTMTAIEKQLATRGTARNWNTVLKVEAAARG